MKIGIIGHGSIGQRHADNAKKLGHLVGTYDPTQPPVPGFGTCTRDYVLREADAIVVASPSKCHAKDLMDALEDNKHVLVEKPFGYDCPPLLEGFVRGTRLRNPSLIIATGFNLRFHNSVQAAKRTLESGILGNILNASFTVNQKTTKSPYLMDGILRNWCSHEIDLAHHLLGDGEVLSCTIDPDVDGRDTKDALIVMKFPAVQDKVYIQADYFSDPEQRYFWIEGEKGTLYCNLVQRQNYLRMNGEQPILFHTANDTWDENYVDEMSCFVSSILGQSHHKPLATGEDGIKALYAVMAAREKAGLSDGA